MLVKPVCYQDNSIVLQRLSCPLIADGRHTIIIIRFADIEWEETASIGKGKYIIICSAAVDLSRLKITIPLVLADAVEYKVAFIHVVGSWNQMR